MSFLLDWLCWAMIEDARHVCKWLFPCNAGRLQCTRVPDLGFSWAWGRRRMAPAIGAMKIRGPDMRSGEEISGWGGKKR